MHSSDGTFNGAGDFRLYYQIWRAEKPPKASLIIVHGFGEHCGRWRNVLEHFPPLGYTVYVYDQRGYGKSPGQRGYINDWSEYRYDLDSFIKLVSQDAPDLPRFLYSQSMGGVVGLDYCLHDPSDLSGYICASPGIGKLGVSPTLFSLAKVLDKIWPTFSMQNPIDAGLLAREAEWVKFVLTDPLSHGRGTARWLVQFAKTVDWIHSHASEWQLPLLLLHGTADRFASIEGSRRFKANTASPDVQLIEYEGGYHELHNDSIQSQVFADVERWLDTRLALLER